MDIISNQKLNIGKTVVALGNFDGLHIGHMDVIKNTVTVAKEKGAKSGVLLFLENTKNVTNNRTVKSITTNAQKLEILKEYNLDFVYTVEFTKDFMMMSCRDFVEFLIEKMDICAVCAGFDYRFGYKASGDIKELCRLGNEYGFLVEVSKEVKEQDVSVSSTYIRELIQKGDIETANKMLGRNFEVSGEVVKGFYNGHKLGFPTANVKVLDDVLLPYEGVYAGLSNVDGKKYLSVINVGKNLTFNAERLTVESHIIDFDGEIYGKKISVEFLKRLRDVKKFESLDALKCQINKDKEEAKRICL